ncbi:hypothetical protein GMRT_12240 [Giardia muris]|uniref:Uncharacterized protein n=1 Tax=Giardia muris TaxID=5742 RepID=A0A4Z1T0V4_GIAMU|nr:hypothetical protein GMRT_12240 [Giardia muris]|eukprot:TNJ30605.1 hypothetical protein GMRT_12240 [Giardia muris]
MNWSDDSFDDWILNEDTNLARTLFKFTGTYNVAEIQSRLDADDQDSDPDWQHSEIAPQLKTKTRTKVKGEAGPSHPINLCRKRHAPLWSTIIQTLEEGSIHIQNDDFINGCLDTVSKQVGALLILGYRLEERFPGCYPVQKCLDKLQEYFDTCTFFNAETPLLRVAKQAFQESDEVYQRSPQEAALRCGIQLPPPSPIACLPPSTVTPGEVTLCSQCIEHGLDPDRILKGSLEHKQEIRKRAHFRASSS